MGPFENGQNLSEGLKQGPAQGRNLKRGVLFPTIGAPGFEPGTPCSQNGGTDRDWIGQVRPPSQKPAWKKCRIRVS